MKVLDNAQEGRTGREEGRVCCKKKKKHFASARASAHPLHAVHITSRMIRAE